MSLTPSRPCLAVILGLLVVLVGGCGGEQRDVVFSTDTPPPADDRPAMLRDIAALGNAKDLRDAAKAKAYHEAVDALIARGARAESLLIEALGGNDDWGVRLGAIEVLKAVGSRRCVEPLLGALEDPEPLVALNADHLLRAMLGHSVIPVAGQPLQGDLPPVPTRAPEDLALDAEERLWAVWHREHKVALHRAWRTWWEANRATVVID